MREKHLSIQSRRLAGACRKPPLVALQELGGWASTEWCGGTRMLLPITSRLMRNASVHRVPSKKWTAQIRQGLKEVRARIAASP
jgi:hypothetical protein